MALIQRQPGENNEEHDFIMRIFITKDHIVLYQPNDGQKRAYASSFKPGLAHSSSHDRNQISLRSASHLKPILPNQISFQALRKISPGS
ncbi:hypothetical protein NC651_017641 [Populus alba x Populus x berolinensis]|nr:hypothetical protein NC651_017641 [Populus alba x Populus x berolinensis]